VGLSLGLEPWFAEVQQRGSCGQGQGASALCSESGGTHKVLLLLLLLLLLLQ